MFCCGVCNAVFTGIYPESVFTTPCGHLFHAECLKMCFNKVLNRDVEPRCPFCSLSVDRTKMIKLYLQIDANWKDTAVALKKQANTSIVNLDESINNSAMMENCIDLNNSSLDEINSDYSIANTSIIHLDESLMKNSELKVNCIDLKSYRKTMLTTSLSGVKLTSVTKNLLTIINDMIENSKIQDRSLMSENKLISTARDIGYTNILIIVMNFGYPIGISFIDLQQNLKLHVKVTSYKHFNNENAANINKNSCLTPKNEQKLNELHEFIFSFFSKSEELNVNKILFPCHNNCNDMEFIHTSVGLSFTMILPRHFNDCIEGIY